MTTPLAQPVPVESALPYTCCECGAKTSGSYTLSSGSGRVQVFGVCRDGEGCAVEYSEAQAARLAASRGEA